MRRPVSVPLALVVTLVLLLGAACSSGDSHARVPVSGSTEPATSFIDWTQHHGSPDHAGRVDRPTNSPLRQAWAAAHLDGAMYGEPLVVGSTLVVATEADRVYGLDATTGKRRWSTRLGRPIAQSRLPCGDIDPLGITGTPAYDARTGSVFAVAAGTPTSTSSPTATARPSRSDPPCSSPGRVVVSFGGLAGDCHDYVGYVTSTSVTGRGRTTHYAVPTAREAGMWSPAGPVRGEQRLHVGTLTHFPSEVVDSGYVFVPSEDGVTAFD